MGSGRHSYPNDEDESIGELEKNVVNRNQNKNEQYTVFTMINTNARSLCPKINSLIDSIDELDASMAIITETWLADGAGLDEDLQDLFLGAGISAICKNRPPDARGLAYGGVGLFFKEDAVHFKRIDYDNPENFEVLAAVGTLRGHCRKMVVIACYVPVSYTHLTLPTTPYV